MMPAYKIPSLAFALVAALMLDMPTFSSAFNISPRPNQQHTLSKATMATTTSLLASSAAIEEEAEKKSSDDSDKPSAVEDMNPDEELMYAMGINLGRQLGDIRPLVNDSDELTQLAKGLLDCFVGKLGEEEATELLRKRGRDLDKLVLDRANNLREKLEIAGREMLKDMAATEGAEELDNGVVLHVLEYGPEGKGKGIRPTASSVCLMHYHGTLADGSVFDSTISADPIQLPLAQVIPGWKDGVLKMHEGEAAMLGIPPEHAYGEKGTPDGSIPGGATLFFKVQLIKILSGGVGGGPALLGVDGKPLTKDSGSGGSGLLGADGKPL